MFDEPEIRPEGEAWLRERAAPRPQAAAYSELLDGEEVALPVHTEEGIACLSRLSGLLHDAVGGAASVSIRQPLVLTDDTKPCPDLALLVSASGAAPGAEPVVLLVVEVADTSFGLTHSRGRKAAIYARAGIPDCWIVDVRSGQVLVHRSPASGGYRDIRNLRAGSALTLASVPDLSIDLIRVLGAG